MILHLLLEKYILFPNVYKNYWYYWDLLISLSKKGETKLCTHIFKKKKKERKLLEGNNFDFMVRYIYWRARFPVGHEEGGRMASVNTFVPWFPGKILAKPRRRERVKWDLLHSSSSPPHTKKSPFRKWAFAPFCLNPDRLPLPFAPLRWCVARDSNA